MREPTIRGARTAWRVGVVLGTRPDAIKLAPVIDAARSHPKLDVVVVGSNQHEDLLQRHLAELDLHVDHELERPAGAETLSQAMARMMAQLSVLLPRLVLGAVMVQGDTTTCVAAALSAFYAGVPVVHVEAGLRSGTRLLPFPEEVHRRLMAQLADLHLAPTSTARDNLIAEGVPEYAVRVTGNTLVDSLREPAAVGTEGDARLARLLRGGGRFVLITMHRRESWGSGIANVVAAVEVLARRWPDVGFVIPAHPNPVVQQALAPLAAVENVIVTAPLRRRDFLGVLARADLALTDSGGVQEEAPSYGVPLLVLRDGTERVEGLRRGVARLVGTDPAVIVPAADEHLRRAGRPVRQRGLRPSPYGDGAASGRCVDALIELLVAAPNGDTRRRPLDGLSNLSTMMGATTR